MSALVRRCIWFGLVAAFGGMAFVVALSSRPALTCRVLEVHRVLSGPTARIEIRNGTRRPVDYWVHSLGQKPLCQWLERYGRIWHHALWDSECGIDLVPATLAPGQTLSFTVSIIHTSSPTRLAFVYQQDGVDHLASTTTITP
jgi:hypothetical protein